MTVRIRARRRGTALIIAIAVGILLTATAWSGLATLGTEAAVSQEQAREDQAAELAEAGLQWAIAKLEKDGAYAGEKERAFAGGKFDVTVEAIPGHAEGRRIRVAGRVQGPRGPWVKAAYVAVLERATPPAGPVWRRLSWRLDAGSK